MKKIAYLCAGLLCTIGMVSAFGVAAQGMTIEVSPGKINRIIKPGESYVQTFRVGNYSGGEKTFYLYTRNFRVIDPKGAPSFDDAGAEAADPKYALTQWMHLPTDRITIADGEVKTVDVTITVPTDAESGGHYGAFFVQTEDPAAMEKQEGSVITSIGRVASLILITVPGDVNENLALKTFKAEKKIYWTNAPTVSFITTLENEGNVHAIPTGAIFVSGGVGNTAQSTTYNKEQGAVLPGAPERTITESLMLRAKGLIPPMGKFDAQFLTKYGVTGAELTGAETFYVIPVGFLSGSFAAAFAVVFVVHRALLSFMRR